MRLFKFLFGSREPDYAELLKREDLRVRIQRGNGDIIEIEPVSAPRSQQPQKSHPNQELHHGRPNGRPNGQDNSRHHGRPR